MVTSSLYAWTICFHNVAWYSATVVAGCGAPITVAHVHVIAFLDHTRFWEACGHDRSGPLP